MIRAQTSAVVHWAPFFTRWGRGQSEVWTFSLPTYPLDSRLLITDRLPTYPTLFESFPLPYPHFRSFCPLPYLRITCQGSFWHA